MKTITRIQSERKIRSTTKKRNKYNKNCPQNYDKFGKGVSKISVLIRFYAVFIRYYIIV